jgi:8-oxo-dGTP diphosphatase
MPSLPSNSDFLHQITLPRIGVGVIVVFPPIYGTTRRRFAWLRRSGTSHGNGQWSLPGGRLEFNEKLIDRAATEVGEEIGIKHFGPFYPIPYISEDFFPEQKMHWITHYFIAYPHNTETARLMEPDKADALAITSDPPGDVFVGAMEAIKYATDHDLWLDLSDYDKHRRLEKQRRLLLDMEKEIQNGNI